MNENRLRLAVVLIAVLALILGGAFSYYYYTSSKTITEQNSTITTQQGQIASLGTQIDGLKANAAQQQTDLTQANSTITSLQSQLTTFQTQLATANSKAASAQSDLTTASSTITSLQSQLTTATSQVTDLQSQLATQQSITGLSLSITEASAYPVSQSAGAESIISSFTATYPGYILVSGSSTSSTGYIRVIDSYSSYYPSSTHYAFGTGTTLIIPVLPGTVYVYFGNTDASGTITGSFYLTYYY